MIPEIWLKREITIKNIVMYDSLDLDLKRVIIQIPLFFPWRYEPGSLKYASKPVDLYTMSVY